MTVPPPDHPYADHPEPGRKPLKSRGPGIAIFISVLALIGVVIIIWMMLQDRDEATDPSVSATPSATPSETATETAEPEPTETAATGGTGTPDDPYWLDQEFIYDSAIESDQSTSAGVWDITVTDVVPVDLTDTAFEDLGCYAVTGTMTPTAWTDGEDGPLATDMPIVSLETEGSARAVPDDEGLCDLSGFDDYTPYTVPLADGWSQGALMFVAPLVYVTSVDNDVFAVVLGEDDFTLGEGIYVSPTARFE
ncbi:hypothetical protein [Demequina sp. NBRC 110052]|uniref:hypothetical protein n=1 Tax=Demequina sp. NBRC 110052 TaxID=1570341 RepID=UPI000A031F05|nr:hypothetical protein [Demequina sp. NBRC 110052]